MKTMAKPTKKAITKKVTAKKPIAKKGITKRAKKSVKELTGLQMLSKAQTTLKSAYEALGEDAEWCLIMKTPKGVQSVSRCSRFFKLRAAGALSEEIK